MQTPGERLAWALERARGAGMSINRLSQELHGVRGSSYGSVRNYITGNSEPPLEFLLAAADKLGVRPAWLIEGKEPVTDAARVLTKKRAALSKRTRGGGEIRLATWTAIQDRFSTAVYPAGREAWEIISGWWLYARENGAVADIDGVNEAIAEALARPLEALGIDPAKIPHAERQEYLLTLAAALRRVLRSVSPPLPEASDAEN